MDKPVPHYEEVVDLDGESIYVYFYKSRKKTSSYSLVLHGLRADTQRMLPIIHHMLKKQHVIAFDLPGHGKSKHTYSMDFQTYNKYCAKITYKFLQNIVFANNHKKQSQHRRRNKYTAKQTSPDNKNSRTSTLNIQKINLFGISNSANTILTLMLNYKLDIKKIHKISLTAPIFSSNNISMSKSFHTFIMFFSKALFTFPPLALLSQKIVDSDLLFNTVAKILEQECRQNEQILEYERNSWRLMPMKLWARSVHDFLQIDLGTVIENNSQDKEKKQLLQNLKNKKDKLIFLYPKKDQYLEVQRNIQDFQKHFPEASYATYSSEKHIPRGDIFQDKAVMKMIGKMVEKMY